MVRKQAFQVLAAVASMAVAGQVMAQQVEPGHEPYVGMAGAYAAADEDVRGADQGYGMQLLLGWKVARDWNVQVMSSYHNFETGDVNMTDFYRSSLGADLMWIPARGRLSPYVVAGVGAVYNDVYPSISDALGVTFNAGLGLTTRPMGQYGLRVRAETRYVVDRWADDPKDINVFLGIDIPLRRRSETVVRVETREVVREVIREVAAPPPATPAPAPVVDTDRDGVPDPQDRCPDTLPGTRVDAQGCAIESAVVTLQGVHFETGSARLTASSSAILQQATAALRGQPTMRVEVLGHTDAVGAVESNQRLSQSRADSVVDFMVNNGISRDRLRGVGYGESQPVADNATAEGRATNRRVEFRVTTR
jgi:OOP family OmpA-OmpF porin